MAAQEFDKSENIILGSGDLYLLEYADSVPEDATIETDENRAGNIKGGAELSYKMDTKTVQDDKGRVKKVIVTSEEVTFKSGLLTWAPSYIEALVASAQIDESSKPNHRIIKLGGLSNSHGKQWLWRFVHTRDDGRKLRVTVTGKNTGAFTLAFDPEKETVLDAEIMAEALDNTGVLVIIDDELTKAG